MTGNGPLPSGVKMWIGMLPPSTYRQLSARGVEFIEAPAVQPWGSFAKFKDPDGNTFVLSSS